MPKTFTRKDYVPEDLLQAGLHHLAAAEFLLNGNPELFDSAGYSGPYGDRIDAQGLDVT